MTSRSEIRSQIGRMSLAQKVGQIFILTWRNFAQAENELKLYPGGFIRIYSDAFTVARETTYIQSLTDGNLLIAADLERGIGGTISGPLEVITAMALGSTGSVEAAYDAGLMIGKEAAAMGISMNYAPVLDVNSNPLNPVINTRSFGSDPHNVARLGVAFSKGLNAGGVASCGKHFPGHGDAGFDSHTNLGTITASRERLEKVDLVPFRQAIAEGIDSIMSAHLLIPALEPDPVPATLSRNIMTGLLREEMGFQGLIVSDALDMGAVAHNFPPEDAIPMAINAGCDQLIMPKNPALCVDILLSAVKRGDVSEDRLHESLERIMLLKTKYRSQPRLDSLSKLISVPEHKTRAMEIASESIVLVRDNGVLPVNADKSVFCLHFSNVEDGRGYYLEPQSFSDYLNQEFQSVTTYQAGNSLHISNNPLPESILASAHAADVILLAAYVNVRLNSGTIDLPEDVLHAIQPLMNLNKPVILISFGSPYIGKQFPGASAFLCACSATQPSQQAMAMAISGKNPISGKLPVDV